MDDENVGCKMDDVKWMMDVEKVRGQKVWRWHCIRKVSQFYALCSLLFVSSCLVVKICTTRTATQPHVLRALLLVSSCLVVNLCPTRTATQLRVLCAFLFAHSAVNLQHHFT